MPTPKRPTFAIIGAGPKGIAVAVKAKVLEEFGLSVDRVVLIEKHGIAAHWSGDFGYTDGEMKLGTSPEKDVVFPIETDVGDDDLNRRIRRRLMDFTWTSFLVDSNRFADWIDRGRPAPCHQLWASYLRWVAERLAPQASIVTAEVTKVDLTDDGGGWNLSLNHGDGRMESVRADRLMLTGPGKVRLEFLREGPLPQGTYDLESFWNALKSGRFPLKGKISIVGAGENAASILLALSKVAPELRIDVIAPKGFVSTRAENFYENQFYSQPEANGWKNMTLEDRADFISRTDLGVFSVHAMRILSEEIRHRIVPGRLIDLKPDASGVAMKIEYGTSQTTAIYDQVILATGFDQFATIRSLFSEEALAALEKAVGAPLNSKSLSERIATDLSLPALALQDLSSQDLSSLETRRQSLIPPLHLPMLAGLRQGPGFANLSCLGLLSDRVILEPALRHTSRSCRADHAVHLAIAGTEASL